MVSLLKSGSSLDISPSCQYGFGSKDFREIDAVGIRCGSCYPGTAFLTGIQDHEGVAPDILSRGVFWKRGVRARPLA